MEIGTTNVSAIFGPYRQALVTATQKFGIPYVVVDSTDNGRMTSSGTAASYETMLPHVRPYNLISVVPHPYDLYSVVFDVLKLFQWPNVAVFYEIGSDGNYHNDLRLVFFIHISLSTTGKLTSMITFT
jgi:hypothetical protein